MKAPATPRSSRFRFTAGILGRVAVGSSLALVSAGFVASSGRPAMGQSLAWPTDAGRCLTSTFCEFRPGHFHSGIDLSTWGRSGYQCFAVGDGEIARVRISCRGYGKALYLRLEDGRTAVYAHLSRFAGPWADAVRAAQEELGSAYLDREFPRGTFPVRRGELVAYTGQSGIGSPHFHFEIRDADERPLDPLHEGFAVEDTAAPSVRRVALTPLTALSSVNGSSDTVILDARQGMGAQDARIPRTIPVEGEIGIAVEIDESTHACRYRLAPSRIELEEEGRVLYAVEYSGFAFSETELMDFQIDPRFSYSRVGHFHNLWKRPGNELSFVSGAGGAGVIRAKADSLAPEAPRESVRELRVVASDAAGNRGALVFSLSFAPPPSVSAVSASLARSAAALAALEVGLEESWADTLEVFGKVQAPGRALQHVEIEFSFDLGATWLGGPRVVVGSDLAFEERFAAMRRVPGEGRGLLVRAQAVDVLGASGLAKTIAVEGAVPPPLASPGVEFVTLGPWSEARFPGTALFSLLAGVPGETFARPWGKGARIVREARSERTPSEGASVNAFDPWGRALPLDLDWALDEIGREGGIARSPRGLSEVRFPEDALAETAAVVIREEPSPNPTGLRPLSALHFVDTGQVPVALDYEIALAVEEGVEFNEKRAALFVQEPERFRFLSAEGIGDARVFRGKTRTPLGVGLFEDTTLPEIAEARIEESREGSSLRFQAADSGSGMDCDGIEVVLNGASLIHEYDEETSEGVAWIGRAASPREELSFEIRATDRCGNSASKVLNLRLP